MPRKNQDDKDIRLVLEWLSHRHITKDELAAALGVSPPTYDRRSIADDFPSYEELERFGGHFEVSARVLQIAFGLRSLAELVLLDENEMRQYVEQGGGDPPPVFPTRRGTQGTGTTVVEIAPPRRRQRRPDAPPGP